MKLLLLIVALLSAQAYQAHAHRYFGAVADAPDAISTAALTFFEHAGVVHWTLNVTDAAPGPLTAAIVDGNPETSTSRVVSLAGGVVGEDGTFSAEGQFDSAAFEPAYAAMPVDELEAHIGMGHIYLEVVTADAELYGALEEAADEAADMEDQDDLEPAGHSVMAMEGGADDQGKEEAADEHAGHNHRRLLRSA